MFLTSQNDNLIKEQIRHIHTMLEELRNKGDYGCIYPFNTFYGNEDIKIISKLDHLNVGKNEVCFNGVMYPISSYYPPTENSFDRAIKAREKKLNKEK